MASDPLIILLHWFSFDVDRGSGFHLFGDFILSFLPPSRLLLPLLSTPAPLRLPPGASAVIQLPSRWRYSSLPECQMFLDRNKLHFFMAYGKLPWLLLLLYPLCELNMYSVACCLQCYCRVTYGTDSIRMKLALDNPLITWILTGSSSACALCSLPLSSAGLHYQLSSLPHRMLAGAWEGGWLWVSGKEGFSDRQKEWKGWWGRNIKD